MIELFPSYYQVGLNIWLTEFLPRIQKILEIPNDDAEAINYLSNKVGLDPSRLDYRNILNKNHSVIFGASPELERTNLSLIEGSRNELNIIAADGATRFLLENSILPDLVVTDMDGLDQKAMETLLTEKIPIQILSHGDNFLKVERVKTYIDRGLEYTLVTQARPHLGWENTLGFTDGDRAAALAKSYSKSCYLIGFNLNSRLIGRYSKPGFEEHQPITERKRLKLEIAWSILRWIALRFPVYVQNYRYAPGIESSFENYLTVIG